MILRTLPGGQRVLVAPQKSGMVWGHDPDQKGKLLWKTQLVDKLALGMITFSGAADDQNAYFGLRSGGVAAQVTFSSAAAWIADHSSGATTPRKFPTRTIRLFFMIPVPVWLMVLMRLVPEEEASAAPPPEYRRCR